MNEKEDRPHRSAAAVQSVDRQAQAKDDGAAPIAFGQDLNLNFCVRNRRIQGDGPPRHGTPARISTSY
jgi:hypothetical protein